MTGKTKCPKCGYTQDIPFSECSRCGIIIKKYLEKEKQEERVKVESNIPDGSLDAANGLIIEQQKEWTEILINFETKNKYIIFTDNNLKIFTATEEGGSFLETLIRFFLRSLRGCTIKIYSQNWIPIFTLKKSFRFFFHKLSVSNKNQLFIGSIERRFAFLNKVYSVINRNGKEYYRIVGPIYRPWTFKIMIDGTECGRITKKWSGLLKETFTDADKFGVVFPKNADSNQKALLMAATLLIDFAHFEDNSQR